MKRVFYAEQTFLTEDPVADALIDYARVLATVGKADVLLVPGVDGDGVVRRYELLVGPASQMLVESTDEPGAGLDVDDVLRDLAERRSTHLPSLEDELADGGLGGPDGL